MKKIKSPVAAILLAIVVSFISANAQSIDCYETNLPSGADCLDWSVETESSPYYYQGYTCPITIKYKFRECTYTEGGCTKTIVQLKPISFSWDWDTTICQGLLSYLFPGYYADDFSYMSPWNFEVMKTNLMDQLSYDFFEDFYAGLAPSRKPDYDCSGTPPNCTFPYCKNYEVFYSSPACQALCHGTFTRNNETRMIVCPLPCDGPNQGCCTQTRYFCMCNGQVYMESESSTSSASCENSTPPYDKCTGSSTPTGYWEERYLDPCEIICPEE